MKTTNWSTSGLRKHIVQIHKIPIANSTLATEKSKTSNSLKKDLHNLVINSVIQDSRSFDYFRRSGMMNFFKKAIPGNDLIWNSIVDRIICVV